MLLAHKLATHTTHGSVSLYLGRNTAHLTKPGAPRSKHLDRELTFTPLKAVFLLLSSDFRQRRSHSTIKSGQRS